MSTLRNDLFRASQLIDVKQMNQIYAAACYVDANKCDVNRICRNVVGNYEETFNLSPEIAQAIIYPKGVQRGGGIIGGKEQV